MLPCHRRDITADVQHSTKQRKYQNPPLLCKISSLPYDSSFCERSTTSRARAGAGLGVGAATGLGARRSALDRVPVGARGATSASFTPLMSYRRRKLVRMIVSCAYR